MKNSIPKTMAIHDISGIGRVSLMVVIPILSTMGIQVTPLPTAVLSAHTEFDDFCMLDLTNQMRSFVNHWKKLNLSFEAIYSGFLGSSLQVDIVIDIINSFKNDSQLIVVDPVLGDNGVAYKSISHDLIMKMRELIHYADVITPNLTEAFLLLDEPYQENVNEEKAKELVSRLALMGPKRVIVTSIHQMDENLRTSVVAYNSLDNRFWKVACNYIPAHYPGTGDIFASVICGSLLQGDSLPMALDRAVQFYILSCKNHFR